MVQRLEAWVSKDSRVLRSLVLWSGWSLLVFWTLFAGIGQSRLWDRDEPRNARCTAEMMEAGDWIVPTFNGQLRTHKPILLYWMQRTAYELFGSNAFSARLPSVIMALAAILAVMWLARLLFPDADARWVGAALATSLMFVVAARAATPDAALIAWSAWGVAGLVASQRFLLRTNPQAPRIDRKRLAIGYVAMGLGMLAKGPVGLVLPSIVAGAWLWLEIHLNTTRAKLPQAESSLAPRSVSMVQRTQQTIQAHLLFAWRWLRDGRAFLKAFASLEPWWGVPLAIAIAAPWYIAVGVRTDGEWLRGFFFEHNLGRAVQSMEGHQGGPWYYPMAALVGLFPWSLLLIPICYWVYRQLTMTASKHPATHSVSEDVDDVQSQLLRQRGCRLGLVWMAVYFLLFSLAKTKLPSYITPCYCGAALLIGVFLNDWSRSRIHMPRWLMQMAGVVAGLAGLAFAVAMMLVAVKLNAMPIALVGVWACGLLLVSFLCWRWQDAKHQSRLAGYWMGAACLLLGGIYAHGAVAVDPYRSDLRHILQNDATPDTAWLAVGTIEPSWVYYLQKPILELDAAGQWVEPALAQLQKPGSRLILTPDRLQELQQAAEKAGLPLKELSRNDRFLRPEVMCIVSSDATSVSENRSANAKSMDQSPTLPR